MYVAAQDDAGNFGPIAVASFRIVGPPDTTITSGPNATTWDSTPTFTFTSTVAGSTFRCRLDGAPFAPCSSPFTTGVLGVGGHSLLVAAVNPDGVVDPSPARRDFSVASVETHTYQCHVQPFPAGRNDGCSAEPAGQRCSFVYSTCVSATAPCPVGARCTLRTDVDWSDEDNHGDANHPGISETIVVYAESSPPTFLARKPPDELIPPVDCQVADASSGPGQCSASSSGEIIGNGKAPYLACFNLSVDPGGDRSLYGPDSARSLTCKLTMQIEAAPSLAVAVLDSAATVYAPGAGVLSIAPAGASAATASVATAHKRRAHPQPAFAPQHKRVPRAGPVVFKLVLSRTEAAALKKHHKLAITVRLTFKPAHGKTQTRTMRITLRVLPKPIKRAG